MIRIQQLAEKYGLPIKSNEMSSVGEGKIFSKEEYNIPLVFGVLILSMTSLYVFIKSDIGYRILSTVDPKESAKPPTPMV